MDATTTFPPPPPPAAPASRPVLINAIELGERIAATRSDPPTFSDRPEMQSAMEMAFRRGIDTAGAVVVNMRRLADGGGA